MIKLGYLPNMRTLIIPDEGMTIIDMDLQRADLYAVAWDANCALMKHRLRTEDIHTRHAIDFLGNGEKKNRDLMKKLAHAADYLVGLKKACDDTGLTRAQIEKFLEYWFFTYPEIKDWHIRVRDNMYRQKYVTNAFGYRRPFYDRLEQCLPEAVAWIAQSTVGIVINRILHEIYAGGYTGYLQPLLQVHDSLTLQCHKDEVEWATKTLIELAQKVIVPYPDPLNIPVSFKTSNISWGDIK